MEQFKTLHAVAVPMLRDNIDTDAILPVAYMKTINWTAADRRFAQAADA